MQTRRAKQIRPVNGVFEQFPDPPGRFRVHAHPGTADEQLGCRMSACCQGTDTCHWCLRVPSREKAEPSSSDAFSLISCICAVHDWA